VSAAGNVEEADPNRKGKDYLRSNVRRRRDRLRQGRRLHRPRRKPQSRQIEKGLNFEHLGPEL
jgi:hypothetical protein